MGFRVRSIGFQSVEHWVSEIGALCFRVQSIGFQSLEHWVSEFGALGFRVWSIGFRSSEHWVSEYWVRVSPNRFALSYGSVLLGSSQSVFIICTLALPSLFLLHQCFTDLLTTTCLITVVVGK